MEKVVVTKKAIRDLVAEIMGNPDARGQYDVIEDESDEPVNVSNVVDQSAAVTDPSNPNFKPQSPTELQIAIKALTDDLPKDQIPNVFDQFKGALETAKNTENIDSKDTDTMNKTDKTKVEEVIRKAIRQELKEMFLKSKLTEAPYVDPADAVADEEEKQQMPKRKGAFKRAALGSMVDVSGASFDEIAKELEFSVAGAKQAVDKALLKAQFVAKMEPEDLEILTLTAMKDYIEYLNKSGELSAADVQLMKDHPSIVSDLDGFREFLAKYVKRARKDAGDDLSNKF